MWHPLRPAGSRRAARLTANWTTGLLVVAVASTALAGLATGLATGLAQAAPADFDPTFTGAGRSVLGGAAKTVEMTELADERFVTVSVAGGGNDAVSVRRFAADGVPDLSFGGTGIAQVGGNAGWSLPGVVVDETGNTYVKAYWADNDTSRIWKFTAAGQLDPSWAGIGRVDFKGSRFGEIALQLDGRLVVSSGPSVYRLTTSGAVDGSFGTAGSGATLPTGQIDALSVLPAGGVYAGGRSASSIDVFKLGPSGDIDAKFGVNGRATYRPTPPLGWATEGIRQVSLGIQNDGRVVAASGADQRDAANQVSSPLVVTRFTAKGAVDGTFDSIMADNLVITGALALQANDKVVVPVSVGTQASLLRLDRDGGVDGSFGPGGLWSDAVADTRSTDVAVQETGRLVAVGVATGEAGQSGLIWGLQGDATPRCLGRYATAYGGNGRDKLTGTNDADVLVGGSGKDTIKGTGGKDRICGGSGKDKLKGGGGRDQIGGDGGRDVIKGQAGKDRLEGGGGNDKLYGAGGRDKLFGNGGRDTLFGGPGKDKLVGGPGRDLTRQ